MHKLKGFSLLLVIFLCVVSTQSLWSQWSFKVYATDGSTWVDSVTIGTDPAATFGIDGGLGEVELPPVPPPGPNQAADLRAVDPTGGVAFGQGLGKDLRDYVSNYQRDIYRLSFRRSDPEGSVVTLSWQSGLGSVGGGGFYMTDGNNEAVFTNVDMSAQTSFTHASFNSLSGSEVFIIAGDGRKFRTFDRDSIALAKDYKNKIGKSENPKRKATGSDGCFTFQNTSGGSADALYVEWSQVIEATQSMGVFISQSAADPVKPKKITYSGAVVPDAGSTTICVWGDKGKQLLAGKWYYKNAGAQVGPTGAKKPPDVGFERLRLRKPNINNVGEELYVQLSFDPANGLVAGNHATKKVIHPKWKDVLKGLYKKGKLGPILNIGNPFCLNILAGKPVTKIQKANSPDKFVVVKGDINYGNRLYAELLALKVNIAASAKGKTQTGFGGLVFNDPNDPTNPYNGQTIQQISDKADLVISCDTVGGLKGSYTMTDLELLIRRLNREFNGVFDTVSFGGPGPGKPTGGTVATGIKALALVDYLSATGPAQEPEQFYNFSEIFDVPNTFELSQNYPNPFNPTTTIEFTLPADAFVTLKVYNMLGQEVATLVDREEMTEGQNYVDFDANTLSTGVYYYRLVVNDGELQQVKKMMLMK